MEDIFVYQVNPAEVKPGAVIEGIDEIQAVTLAWRCYDQGRKDYWNGIRDTMPQEPKEGIQEVERRYPRAAVYLAAEKWVNSREPIMIRLGKEAQERLLNGDDPDAVLTDMVNRHDAFKLAQEGWLC